MEVKAWLIPSAISPRRARETPLHIAPDDLDRIERHCPLTDEERAVLRYRARGFTLLEISFRMADDFGARRPGGTYSDRTVDRRIRSIKDKLARAGE